MAVIKSKKAIALLIISLLAAVFCTIAVSAFFISNDTVTNKFTVADPKVAVVETPENGPYEWGFDTKEVKLRNDSDNMNGYVRCTLFPVVTNADGNVQNIGTATFSDPDFVVIYYGDIILYLNESWADDWVYKDGYFYYKHELSPGESTPTLLSGVIFNGDNTDKYKDLSVTVNVSADIIQKEAIIKDNAWEDIKISSDNTLCIA